MDQAKAAAQLQNPNILKIFGIGKVEHAYYISYEHVEGKSLRAILDRCRQESFPFQVEHALLIASKVASALEYAHGRRNDAGARYFHGLLTPRRSSCRTKARCGSRASGSGPATSRRPRCSRRKSCATSRRSRREAEGIPTPTSTRWEPSSSRR